MTKVVGNHPVKYGYSENNVQKHHNRTTVRSQVHTGGRTTCRPRSYIHNRSGKDTATEAIGQRTGGTEAQVLILSIL